MDRIDLIDIMDDIRALLNFVELANIGAFYDVEHLDSVVDVLIKEIEKLTLDVTNSLRKDWQNGSK